MDLIIPILIFGGLFILMIGVAFLFAFSERKQHKAEIESKNNILREFLKDTGLNQLSMYVPPCDSCGGRGWYEERTGSMAHHTSRKTCPCRYWENWCLKLVQKWVSEGDTKHASELLSIILDKI